MGRTEQVRTVDTPDFYNTINIDIEKSIWLYVINNVSLLATLLRVCKVIRLLAQVTWQHEWVAKIWTVHKSVILFLELEFCIKRRREHSPCWLLPEMRQSSFFFLRCCQLCNCRRRLLSVLVFCYSTKHIFCTALSFVCAPLQPHRRDLRTTTTGSSKGLQSTRFGCAIRCCRCRWCW